MKNIVLIETDQLSAKWLGCYGNSAAHTPNIDKLASEGATFDHCYANNPVCMPSRASTLTGRSCQHHGVFYNGWELGTDVKTFPQVLQENGYQTLGMGKFHHECHGRSAYNDVLKYGFDCAEVTEDIRAGDWLDWVEKEHPDYYEKALSTCWPMAGLENYGDQGINLNEKIQAARKKFSSQGGGFSHKSLLPDFVSQTYWITSRSMDFLEERNADKPFFLKMSYVDPHDPYDPPENYLDLIDDSKIASPIQSEDESIKDIVNDLIQIPFVGNHHQHTVTDWMNIRKAYLASLAFIDEQVGRFMDYLKTNDLLKDTVIIFTSDHGDMLGDHSLPTKGSWHFEGTIHIPLIIYSEDQPKVHDKQTMVNNLDVFPTILDIAGIQSQLPLEGCSLMPIVRKETECLDRENAVLVETYGAYGSLEPYAKAKSVVAGNYRYTLFENGKSLLFDLENDPDESQNLSNDPECQQTVLELKDKMLRLLFNQNCPLPARNKNPYHSH